MTVLAKPQAEIHVFETAAIPGVKSSRPNKHFPSDQHASASHNLKSTRMVDRGVIRWESRVNVAGLPVLTDHDACVLDCPVRVNEFVADDGRLGVIFRVADENVQPTGLRHRV